MTYPKDFHSLRSQLSQSQALWCHLGCKALGQSAMCDDGLILIYKRDTRSSKGGWTGYFGFETDRRIPVWNNSRIVRMSLRPIGIISSLSESEDAIESVFSTSSVVCSRKCDQVKSNAGSGSSFESWSCRSVYVYCSSATGVSYEQARFNANATINRREYICVCVYMLKVVDEIRNIWK